MTSHFGGRCGSMMYRFSFGYPGLLWIPQGVINDAEFKLEIEQWTCRRVAYLGGLPFTDKFEKNWSSDKQSGRRQ